MSLAKWMAKQGKSVKKGIGKLAKDAEPYLEEAGEKGAGLVKKLEKYARKNPKSALAAAAGSSYLAGELDSEDPKKPKRKRKKRPYMDD